MQYESDGRIYIIVYIGIVAIIIVLVASSSLHPYDSEPGPRDCFAVAMTLTMDEPCLDPLSVCDTSIILLFF